MYKWRQVECPLLESLKNIYERWNMELREELQEISDERWENMNIVCLNRCRFCVFFSQHFEPFSAVSFHFQNCFRIRTGWKQTSQNKIKPETCVNSPTEVFQSYWLAQQLRWAKPSAEQRPLGVCRTVGRTGRPTECPVVIRRWLSFYGANCAHQHPK